MKRALTGELDGKLFPACQYLASEATPLRGVGRKTLYCLHAHIWFYMFIYLYYVSPVRLYTGGYMEGFTDAT